MPPLRRVVRAARDRRGADPLRRVPARGALLPPHLRHRRSTGSRGRPARRNASSAGSAPTSSTARSTTSRERASPRRSSSCSPGSTGRATRSRRRSSRPVRCPPPRSRARRDSSSNVADGGAHHPLRVRRADQRGVHGASPEAAASRRPALLLVRARDRAARGDRRRVPRPLRQHRPPLRPARGPREPVRHGAERGVDDGRVRGGRADAVAARPLGLPRPDALRRPRRPGDRGGWRPRGTPGDAGRGRLGADARRARRDDVRARDDERAHDRRRGARRRARGLPGLRPRDDRRLPGCAASPRATSAATCTTPRANGGEGESHAWVDVHVGDTWISLDPTHDTAQTERYVRVGVGRDYADVPPSRGVYRGTATETLEVAVTIREP